MKLLKQFVRGKPFKEKYLAFDGWGLWCRLLEESPWIVVGLRSKFQPRLCELIVDSDEAPDNIAYDAASSVDDIEIYEELSFRSGGGEYPPTNDKESYHKWWIKSHKWWINYYTKLGLVVVDHFSKKLMENVLVELDLALDKGEDVNGDLLTYVHKQYRKDIK